MAAKRKAHVIAQHGPAFEHTGPCGEICDGRGPATDYRVFCVCDDHPHGECSAVLREVRRLYGVK